MSSTAVARILGFILQVAAVTSSLAASKAVPLSNGVTPPEVQSALDASDAQAAAESAKDAAAVANGVAERSVSVAAHAHAALKHAKDVLQEARVASQGLSPTQKKSLTDAEAHLTTAAQTTHMAAASQPAVAPMGGDELGQMQQELSQLRDQIVACRKEDDTDKSIEQMDGELRELQGMLKSLEDSEASKPPNSAGHGELKVEIQHLRESIHRLEKFGSHRVTMPETVEPVPLHGELRYRMQVHRPHPKVQLTPLVDLDMSGANTAAAMETTAVVAPPAAAADVASCPPPCQSIDIDTEMPYGELEPFGREDTAQELTESSIRESDAMVDQLERAEVSEEKRAVFRALTRLRGAAITSYDGVARSQTGNIDEYNKVHKWRSTHPLRHLADEESDVSKWAFPDNAD